MGMPITVDVVGATDGAIARCGLRLFRGRRPALQHLPGRQRDRGDQPRASRRGRLQRRDARGACARRADETRDRRLLRHPHGRTARSILPASSRAGRSATPRRSSPTAGARDFFIDAGGDIQSSGRNAAGKEWSVGIRNPFNAAEIIKVVYPRGRGIATSGTYVRGQHIYDPHAPGRPIVDIVSLTVIGPDVLEADRFATAAFAMGKDGIVFIEQTPGLEGYVVDSNGRATLTSGFEAYCAP